MLEHNSEFNPSEKFFNESTSSKTIKNIKGCLKNTLVRDYNITDKTKLNDIINGILKIHGLHADNFDVVLNSEKLINNNISDLSVDANANKSEVSIPAIRSELGNPTQKLVGYDMLYKTLVELYGKSEADRLSGLLYSYDLGISDSTKILSPYCYSFDFTKLVLFGRPWGSVESTPPKRISSYLSALAETVHQLSNHIAGAVAIGSFVLDLAHLLIYKEKVSLFKLKNSKKFRKYFENEIQQFAHSINHLSRNAVETPFSNVSLFDPIKIAEFLKDDAYGWYFNNEVERKYLPNKKISKKYIVEYIMEIQNIYCDFIDKGDPVKNGRPYPFPVNTQNMSKSFNKETSKFEYSDPKFVDHFFKNRDFFKYNLYISEGQKSSMCCRLILNDELMELGGQSNSLGGGASISLGSHRVVTPDFFRFALKHNSVEGYKSEVRSKLDDTAKILVGHKKLLAYLSEKGMQPFISNGYIQMGRLFSTFGHIGLVETQNYIANNYKGYKGEDIIKESLELLNEKARELSKKYDIIINIEQIPGESFGERFPRANKLIFGEKKVGTDYYSNQYIPTWEKTTINKRIKVDGKYNALSTGGGIAFLNFGEKLTSIQARNIADTSLQAGCEHFNYNGDYNECLDCGHHFFGDAKKCPSCNSNNFSTMSRTVGFYVPVNNFTKTKRENEYNKRVKY
jgi:ribonucleoside-triphosphate reductase